MSVKAAATEVLKKAQSPLHAKAIAEQIIAAGLWISDGKTPEATVSASLYSDIKKNGDKSIFAKVGPQTFALRDSTEIKCDAAPVPATVQEAPKPHPTNAGFSFTDCAHKVLEAFGYSKGGFSTKVHLRNEGNGRMITLALTPGHRHETIAFHELMETGAVKRQGRGRPRIRPDRLSGDKAYSSGEIREYLRRHNIRITIPRKKNETSTGKFDKIIYKLRNRIERFINRMKHFRSLATRYDKSASSYRALWIIGAMLLWLQ